MLSLSTSLPDRPPFYSKLIIHLDDCKEMFELHEILFMAERLVGRTIHDLASNVTPIVVGTEYDSILWDVLFAPYDDHNVLENAAEALRMPLSTALCLPLFTVVSDPCHALSIANHIAHSELVLSH